MANGTKGLNNTRARQKMKEGILHCSQKEQNNHWDVNQVVIWYVRHSSKSRYKRAVNF
jgi:hypothetical protein